MSIPFALFCSHTDWLSEEEEEEEEGEDAKAEDEVCSVASYVFQLSVLIQSSEYESGSEEESEEEKPKLQFRPVFVPK